MAPGATAYEWKGKSDLVDDDLWSVLRNAFDEDPPDDILQWLSYSGYTTWCTFTFMSPDEIPKYEDNQLPLSNCSISVLRRLNEKIRYAFERNEQEADQASFYTKEKICAVTRKSRKRKANEREIDAGLVYESIDHNGVLPRHFRDRKVLQDIVATLPSIDLTDRHEDCSHVKTGYMLEGPPASGKTSILGKLIEVLKQKYPNVPVLYVSCAYYDTEEKRKNLLKYISSDFDPCFVILDDAQHFYEWDRFWLLFKCGRRFYILASTDPVLQFLPDTPVSISKTHHFKCNLTNEESTDLLHHMKIDECHHTNLKTWFGDNYGCYEALIPKLMKIWEEKKKENKYITLHETYYQAQTIRKVGHGSGLYFPRIGFLSFLPHARELLLAICMGTASNEERMKLIQYGILAKEKDGTRKWPCDFVCREYSAAVFHNREYDSCLFEKYQDMPGEVELFKKGLGHLDWVELKKIAQSRRCRFPEKDTWEGAFYKSIGKFIPQSHTFCSEEFYLPEENCYGRYKEKKLQRYKVDFVLRHNESKRAIKFFVCMDDVVKKPRNDVVKTLHQRFEAASFESYLVVHMKSWDTWNYRSQDFHTMPDTEKLQVASKSFESLGSITRKKNHALLLVSGSLSWFYLYTYNCEKGFVEEYCRGTSDISSY